MSFERARFETVIPQSAPEAELIRTNREAERIKETMSQFDSFLGRINDQHPGEESDESAPEEG